MTTSQLAEDWLAPLRDGLLCWTEGQRAVVERILQEHDAAPLQWRCFHCDEVFTDEAAAREHFGNDLGAQAGCVIHSGHIGLLGTIRLLEGRNKALLQRAQEAEMEAESLYGLRAELRRYFGVSDPWSCWNRWDEEKGRVIALEEKVAELESQLTKGEV